MDLKYEPKAWPGNTLNEEERNVYCLFCSR